MTREQAYIKGFVKRASEHGIGLSEAIELLKSSGVVESLKKHVEDYKEKHLKSQYDYKGSPSENFKEHFKNYKEKHLRPSDKGVGEKIKDSVKAHAKMKASDRLMSMGRWIDENTK